MAAWLFGMAGLFAGLGLALGRAAPPIPRLAERLEALRGDAARLGEIERRQEDARARGPSVGRLAAQALVQRTESVLEGRLELLVSEEVARKLRWSGTGMRPDTFGAIRLIATGAGTVALGLGSTVLSGQLFALFPMALVGAGLGWIAPDVWLNAALAARRGRIEREMPSYIDLLATSARAGLSLEAAITRLERETGGDLARIFGRAVRSIEVGQTTEDALRMAAEDVGMREVEQVAETVARAKEYGTPYSDALREIGTMLRAERRNRAQEKANRMGTIIVIPLIVFILPVTILYIGYPAISSLFAGVFNGSM